jgi:hypothetical protein
MTFGAYNCTDGGARLVAIVDLPPPYVASQARFDRIVAAMRAGEPLPPIEMIGNHVTDGGHRTAAAIMLGITHVPVVDYQPPSSPPLGHVIVLNQRMPPDESD